MQWSCPHCGVILAIGDDALGTGWSFSRCYKCGGYALVRRAEINIIKVDKAPPGEKIILPEASIDPTTRLMSTEATEKVAKYVNSSLSKKQNMERQHTPDVLTTRQSTLQPTLQSNVNTHKVPPLLQTLTQKNTDINTDINTNSIALPDPLPETVSIKGKYHIIPIGISSASLLMITSGIYLYIQGQNLWNKSRESTSKWMGINTIEEHPPADHLPADHPSADHLMDEKPTASLPSTLSNNLISEEKKKISALNNTHEIIDQVQKSAMAPDKEPQQPEHHATAALIVKVNPFKANIHSGPGMQFSVIATALPNTEYPVADWSNRWFKLLIQKTKRNVGEFGGYEYGWIRNDMVHVLSKSAE